MSDNKKKEKRHLGDRFDGKLLRDIDPMHIITPLLYPNRADNEAYIAESIDLAPIRAYLEKKNAGNPVFKYTMFHVMVTAMIKVLTLRPKLNRFIANKNTYQRYEITASFVVKKLFTDEAKEGLASSTPKTRTLWTACMKSSSSRSAATRRAIRRTPPPMPCP